MGQGIMGELGFGDNQNRSFPEVLQISDIVDIFSLYY